MSTIAINESIIQGKSFDFAVKIVNLSKTIEIKYDATLLRQLVRSATSIAANVNEASAGQTKKDFITKMAISSKEAREALFWLRLLKETNYYNIDLEAYISDCSELVRILTKIVKTSQGNIAAASRVTTTKN